MYKLGLFGANVSFNFLLFLVLIMCLILSAVLLCEYYFIVADYYRLSTTIIAKNDGECECAVSCGINLMSFILGFRACFSGFDSGVLCRKQEYLIFILANLQLELEQPLDQVINFQPSADRSASLCMISIFRKV